VGFQPSETKIISGLAIICKDELSSAINLRLIMLRSIVGLARIDVKCRQYLSEMSNCLNEGNPLPVPLLHSFPWAFNPNSAYS